MKRLIAIVFLLVLLSGCGPEIKGLQTREKVVQKEVQIIPKEIFDEPNATKIIEQVSGVNKTEWGFDDANNLVLIKKGVDEVKFYYKDGFLKKISDGDKNIELEYFNGYLSSVSGDTDLPLHYVVEDGLLVSADDYHFTYTSEGNLWIFREGLGSPLTWYYNQKEPNKLDFFKKGNVVTHFYYTDKNQLKHVDDNNVRHLILGYGREQRLASLSGELYGVAETFDYDSGRVQIISNLQQNIFYGDDEVLRKKAFDYYMACTRIRNNFMVFEPIAYVVLNNYFGMSTYDYMLQNFYCRWII